MLTTIEELREFNESWKSGICKLDVNSASYLEEFKKMLEALVSL